MSQIQVRSYSMQYFGPVTEGDHFRLWPATCSHTTNTMDVYFYSNGPRLACYFIFIITSIIYISHKTFTVPFPECWDLHCVP